MTTYAEPVNAAESRADFERMTAEVKQNGGEWLFPALFNLAGQRVRAKRIQGAYGPCWQFFDAQGLPTGKYLNVRLCMSTMRERGYYEHYENAPAFVRYAHTHEGLRYAVIDRKDAGYPPDAVEP